MSDQHDEARAALAQKRRANCAACQGDETADLRCTKSRRPCGHHCNHVMTHDACDWCGATWGEDGEQAPEPRTPENGEKP